MRRRLPEDWVPVPVSVGADVRRLGELPAEEGALKAGGGVVVHNETAAVGVVVTAGGLNFLLQYNNAVYCLQVYI